MSDFDTLTLKQNRDLGDKIGSAERAKRFLSGELLLVERSEAQKRGVILRFERKAKISARPFVSSESFTKSNTKVKFGYIDPLIEKLFGKIREDVPAGEVAIHALLEDQHDPEIMVSLGPQSVRYTKLGQLYQLLEAQGEGQEGPLLVNGYANVAYVIDENGAPWAVGAYWYGDGWFVCVCSVARRGRWLAGSRILSQVTTSELGS